MPTFTVHYELTIIALRIKAEKREELQKTGISRHRAQNKVRPLIKEDGVRLNFIEVNHRLIEYRKISRQLAMGE